MTATKPFQQFQLETGGLRPWERGARFWSGMILLSFVLTHFLNHALGIFGIPTMEAVQEWRSWFWRTTPASIALYGAIAVHLLFVTKRIVGRRTWRMPLEEALQILLGLTIPFLVYDHILATRYAAEYVNVNSNYGATLQHLWPSKAVKFFTLITIVWLHAMIGVHYNIRTRSWYPRWRDFLLILAITIPLLAFAGFVAGGREAVRLADKGAVWTETQAQTFQQAADIVWTLLMLGIIALLAIIMILAMVRRYGQKTTVRYLGHGTISLPKGSTLLEGSRANGIPHPSLCGGRARCSTCRVLIESGADTLPPPGPNEATVLKRISAPSGVRLACQIKPTQPISVQVLLANTAKDTLESINDAEIEWGSERVATMLVVDIRAFSQIMETQPPFDVVALLNRFLAEMRQSVEAHGGLVTMLMNDGLMAVFGANGQRNKGSKAALAAAEAMINAIESINMQLHAASSVPIRIGVGVHTGPIVLARLGDVKNGFTITALGETVTIASHLERATKRYLTDCLVSGDTLEAAGMQRHKSSRHEITVPGLHAPVVAFGIDAFATETAPAA